MLGAETFSYMKGLFSRFSIHSVRLPSVPHISGKNFVSVHWISSEASVEFVFLFI